VVMTEAIFVATILADPELQGVSAVLFDFKSRSIVASRAIGRVTLETDVLETLPPPTWEDDCRQAAFDADFVGRGIVRLP